MKKKIFFCLIFFILSSIFLFAPESYSEESFLKTDKGLPRIQPINLEEGIPSSNDSISKDSEFSETSSSKLSNPSKKFSFKNLFRLFPFMGKREKKEEKKAKNKQEDLSLNLRKENSSLFMKEEKEKDLFPQKKAFSRMLLSLIFVFALGGFIIFFSKWWKRKYHFTTKHKQIHMVTQYHLDSKKRLVIVRVAGEHLLLGLTDQNISLLKTLSLLEEGPPIESEESFSSQFLQMKNLDSSSSSSSSQSRSNVTSEKREIPLEGLEKMRAFVEGKLRNKKKIV